MVVKRSKLIVVEFKMNIYKQKVRHRQCPTSLQATSPMCLNFECQLWEGERRGQAYFRLKLQYCKHLCKCLPYYCGGPLKSMGLFVTVKLGLCIKVCRISHSDHSVLNFFAKTDNQLQAQWHFLG